MFLVADFSKCIWLHFLLLLVAFFSDLGHYTATFACFWQNNFIHLYLNLQLAFQSSQKSVKDKAHMHTDTLMFHHFYHHENYYLL